MKASQKATCRLLRAEGRRVKRINLSALFQSYRPYLLSGLLLGISWPSYPYVRLEVLAWVWMAPMLLALKEVKSLWRFLLNVCLAAFSFSVFGMSWLITSTVLGTVLLFFVGGLVVTVPFVAFYFIRRALGWRAALWSAPVVWTSWDWLYHQSEGSLGWLALGVTQSNLYWLVQYVDSTGVWGVSFWLVLFNVLVVMAIDEFRTANFGLRIEESTPQGESQILSSFRIQQAAIRNRLIRRLAVIAVVMLLPPLAYSAFSFVRASRHAANGREITVLLVQPNIDPWRKFDAKTGPAVLAKTRALTDSALTRQKPDLIVWPESAVPYFFLAETPVQEFVKRAVSHWDVPLLTGVLDQQIHNNSQTPMPPPENEPSKIELFNAALLLTPESRPAHPEPTLNAGSELSASRSDVASRWLNVNTSELYRKRIL